MSFGITASRGGKIAGGLVSAFGSALHGSHRGPRGFFPEPVDVWLAVLMDAVPLYQKSVVIYPSTMSDDRASALLVRAKEHLPSVHLAPLRKRRCSDDSPVLSCEGSSKPSSEVATTLLPAFLSPLESITPQSLDLVVFAANVFGEEMLYDAPWHMSLAHRCLRPHGVVAIIGYDTRVRVVAPETAQRDANDFLEDLQRRASEVVNESDSQDDISKALKRSLDVSSSLSMGHADTYFPFPSTKRRWFVSEYSVSPAQLAASYRVLPEYQLLSEGRRRHNLPFYNGEEREGDAINVCRRSCVDPLEALQVCLKAHDTLQGRRELVSPSLRAHVRHFVVTCSARSINSHSQHHQISSSGRHLPE